MPRGAMLTSRQLLQAWHVGFFQLPWLPEAAVRSRGGRFAVALLKHSGLGDDLARAYADRLINDPGGLAGALRWYRAMPILERDQERVAGDLTGASPRSTNSVWARRSTSTPFGGAHQVAGRCAALPSEDADLKEIRRC